MKKLLSLFLALVMALSLCTTAFAGNTTEVSVLRLTGDAADQVVDLRSGQRLSTDSSTLVRLNVLEDPSVEEYTVTLDGEKLTPDHSTSQYHFYAVPAAQSSDTVTLNVSTQALDQGDGTAENPYKIATADELKAFRDRVNAGEKALNAVLTADITLNEEEDWAPIGPTYYKVYYTGTFDGGNHTISGMNSVAGLFGSIGDGAVIKNLTIADSTVSAATGYGVGAVVGDTASNSNLVTLENCHVAKSVTVSTTSSSVRIGGLLGRAQAPVKLVNCSNQADVTVTTDGNGSSSFAGGLIGQVRKDATLEGCFNSGNITAQSKTGVGGLIGQTNQGAAAIVLNNVYCTGNVTSTSSVSEYALNVGGLIGMAQGTSTTITDAYSAGTVKNGSSAGFGIGAANGTAIKCTNVYTTAISAGTSGKITGVTNNVPEASMKDMAEALGEGFKADFAGIKSINNGYPLLAWQVESSSSGEVTIKGTGTADDPYQITSAADLAVFRDKVNGGSINACAKLMNDITLDTAVEWTPIGNGSASIPDGYTGTFDGDGHTISGLTMKNAAEKSGLIGTAGEDAVIKNLTISGSSLTGTERYIGAFVGYTEKKITLSNCHTTTNVTVTGARDVGGLVGGSASASSWITMDGCSNAATVTGTALANNYSVGVGGLIGTAYWGAEITDSCNTGKVQATGATSIPAGGLVGYANANYPKPEKSLVLTNVYNTGEVVSASANTDEAKANGLAGGLVGYAKWGFTITNAYSTMTAKLSNGSAYGGVIVGCIPTKSSTNDGYKTPDVTVSGVYAASVDDDSYVVSQINANKLSAVQKVSDADMKARAMAAKLGDGFAPDFGEANGGYPVLAWQAVPDPDTVDNFNTAGTEEAPYRIATADGLKKFRDIVNANDTSSGGPGAKACAVLVADIVLEKSEKWTAIGTSSNKYTGTFDGNGHTISGVVMEGTYDIGFFADTNKSNTAPVIKNLTIADSSFTTTRGDAGAFLGWGGGVFENCHTTSSVTVTNKNGSAGGIVGSYATQGQSDEFTLNQCSNSATITGTTYCGGIIGKIGSGKLTMTQCFNAGTVTGGSTAVGGLIGHVEGGAASSITHTMTDVYNVGSVSSEKGTNVGGLIGQTTRMLTIKNAYQHSTVSNKNGTGAAIVGNTSAAITLVNVYKTGSLADKVTGTGTITGKAVTKTEAELKELAAQLGGSFIKDMAGDAAVNNGFPIFRWQNPVAASADTLKVTAKDQSGTAALDSEGSTDPKNPTEKTISFECGFLNTFAADRIYLNPGAENTGTVELGLALSESGELSQTLTSQKDGYTADELYFYRTPAVVERTVYAVHTQDGTARYYKINIQRTAVSTARYGAISADWRDDNPVIDTTYDATTGYLTATVKVQDAFARYTNGAMDDNGRATGLLTYNPEFKYYAADAKIKDIDANQVVRFARVGWYWMANESATDSRNSIPTAAWWGSKNVADSYINAANALKAQTGYSSLPAELRTAFENAVKAVSDSWSDGTAAQPLYLDTNGNYTTTATALKARDAMGAPMTGEYKLEQQENLMLDYMDIVKTYLNDSTLGSLKYRALQNVLSGITAKKDKLKTVTALAIADDTTKSAYEYYRQRVWRIVNASDMKEINSMISELGVDKVALEVTSAKTQVIVGDKAYDPDLTNGSTDKGYRTEVTVNVSRGTGMQRVYFTRTQNVTVVTSGWEAILEKGYTANTAYFYDTPTEQSLTIAVDVNEGGTTRYYNVKVVYPAQSGLTLGPNASIGTSNYRENAPGSLSSYDSSTGYISGGVEFGSMIYASMNLYTDGKAGSAALTPVWPTSTDSLYYKAADSNQAYFGRVGYYWLPVTVGTTSGLLPMRTSISYNDVASCLKAAETARTNVTTLSGDAKELMASVYNKINGFKYYFSNELYLDSSGSAPEYGCTADKITQGTSIQARTYFGAPLYGDSLVEKELNTLLDLTDIFTTWSTDAELAAQQFEAYQKVLGMTGVQVVMDIQSTADRDQYQQIRQAKWDIVHASNLAGINAVLKSLNLPTIGSAEPEVTPGDINGDGEVDIIDAGIVVQYANGIRTDLSEKQLQAADVNGDGEVDIIDAGLIVQFANGLRITLK